MVVTIFGSLGLWNLVSVMTIPPIFLPYPWELPNISLFMETTQKTIGFEIQNTTNLIRSSNNSVVLNIFCPACLNTERLERH